MLCDLCGKQGAAVRQVSRSYGNGAKLFVIENGRWTPMFGQPDGWDKL